MKFSDSRLPVLLSSGILLMGSYLLGTDKLEYCGQAESLRPRCHAAATADAPQPTPAPPRNIVIVRVESNKPDLEVAWAEN